MKICFMCDLHLPCCKEALQNDVLEWALSDIQKKGADCIVFAGDVTCDGNESVYRAFIDKVNALDIPFLYIPGNSDLRCAESKEIIKKLSSPVKNVVDGQVFFAVNDCNASVDDDTLKTIEQADENSIVGCDLVGFCKKLGIPCGIAHTDLFKYCDMYGYNYDEFFKSLADNGIFWEMNVTYDSIHSYREHQYVFDLISDKIKQDIVKKAGTVISIGCDSHRCEDYDGFKVHSMYDFLTDNGFETVNKLLGF